MWASTKKKITGSDDGAGEPDHGGKADARGREQCLQFAAVEIGGGEAAGGPDEGGDAGDDIGHGAPGGGAGPAASGRCWRGRHWRRGAAAPSASQVPACGAREQVGGCRRGACSRWHSAWRGRLRAWLSPGWRSSASWMACSASSVGSGDFCGIFAIRSSPRHYAGQLRPEPSTCAGRATSAVTLRSRGCRKHRLYRRPDILSAWHCERNRAGKDFFIIVNFLLTMTFPAPPGAGRIDSAPLTTPHGDGG